jgi:hypothetical protein
VGVVVLLDSLRICGVGPDLWRPAPASFLQVFYGEA